jgi:hypothetical protein
MFQLSIPSLIGRFYLMMLVGIIAVFTHQNWLIAVTFAIAASAVLGYRIPWRRGKEAGKIIPMTGAPAGTHRKAG